MEVIAPSDKKAFSGIEIGRFLCAFSVVVFHYSHFFATGVTGEDVDVIDKKYYPLYSWLGFFYHNGHFAVPVFWMVSGFIFFWKYGERVHNHKVTTYQFFILRFSRLYPLHFATLIVVAILQIVYFAMHNDYFIYPANDLPHFLLQLVFASNWWGSTAWSFNGPIWSVSVEVLAYAFFFVIIRFLKPSWLLCLAVFAVFKMADHFVPQNVFSCIQYFFIGGFIVTVTKVLTKTQGLIVFWLCVIGAIGIAATKIGGGTVLIFAFCFVTACVMFNEVFNIKLTKIAKLGDLTYASYLLHFPIQLAAVLVLDWLGFPRSVFLSPIALAAFIVAVFGLSWIVFRAYEMPAQDRIRGLALPQKAKSRVAVAVSGSPP